MENRVLDLVLEVGELSKEVLKETNYGETTYSNTDQWIEEYGNVLFSLICIANATGIDMVSALEEFL